MMQQTSRYASATIPARALLGELTIDVLFRARPWRERRDEGEHVRDGWARRANRTHGHLDLAIDLIDRLVEIDVPAMKPTAYDHAVFHKQNLARPGVIIQPPNRFPGHKDRRPWPRAPARCSGVP